MEERTRQISRQLFVMVSGVIVMGLVLGGTIVPSVSAQEMFVYPAKGQSPEQQKQDEFECYNWAKNNTGFDPMAPPTTETVSPPQGAPEGGAVKGAARGALLGTLIGGIASDDWGKGAAIGAVGGGLIGGMRRNDQVQRQQQAQQQWAQEEAAKYESKRRNYNRAYGACLEGRGYTIK